MKNMGLRRERKKKRRRWLRFIIINFFIFILSVFAGYLYYLYASVKDTAEKMNDPQSWQGSAKRANGKANLLNGDPVSILLMGVDERAHDSGRTDTLIMVTLNPEKESMYMFNIPRDTRTEIIGKGFEDKINHAYAFGDVKMTIETVENFLQGVPVDYFVKVNMESFKQIVDALGGVHVNNKFAFSYDGETFPAGQIFLDNGEKALKYTRMRYDDPKGDFGRQERQREVIRAIIEEGAQISNLTRFTDILAVLGDNIKTNLTFEEMKLLQKNYKNCRFNIQSFVVNGKGTMIDEVYYYIVSQEERQKISNQLKEHLGIK